MNSFPISKKFILSSRSLYTCSTIRLFERRWLIVPQVRLQSSERNDSWRLSTANSKRPSRRVTGFASHVVPVPAINFRIMVGLSHLYRLTITNLFNNLYHFQEVFTKRLLVEVQLSNDGWAITGPPGPPCSAGPVAIITSFASVSYSCKSWRVPIPSSFRNSVSVVTCRRTTSSLPTSTFPRPHLIAAVDIQISQTVTTRAVVFELFSTKQAKLMREDCTACIPVWSLVKHLRNQIWSLDSRFLATRHTATSKAVHQTHFARKDDAAERGLATRD